MNRVLRFDVTPACFAAAAALSILLSPTGARAATPWDIAPRGAWTAPAPLPVDSHAEQASRGGVRIVLSESQVRVSDTGVERYVHEARHVVGSAGVERVAEARASFDPQYERLHLHAVRVLRDGASRNVLAPDIVRTFFEENDEDARIYDGRMAALIVIPDVRVGDIVETEMTIVGANPVFHRMYADSHGMGSAFDARMIRFRLLTPMSRVFAAQLQAADVASTTREVGSLREQTWTREEVAGFEWEGDVPAGFEPIPRLRISEYRSWEDVGQWAQTLFPIPKPQNGEKGASSSALETALDTIRRSSPVQAERALAAVRLVQDDVRYLGLELGENSHRPHDPETVLKQRFGDCKDKAYLLVHLLQGLGIDAHVALVNASRGDAVPGMLPSPGAFNHAIVHATVDGTSVFIDATVSGQGGTFLAHPIGNFGHALCVAAGAKGLTPIPRSDPDGPTQATVESYRRRADGAIAFDVRTTYRDEEGDGMRRYASEVPPTEISKRYLNAYAKMYTGIEEAAPLEIRDDRNANAVVVREHYVIPESHGFDWSYDASSLREPLSLPRTIRRKLPLEVAHPLYRRHQIEMTLDGHAAALPSNLTRQTAAFSFGRTTDVEGDTVRITYNLQTLTSQIAPSDLESHLRAIKDLRGELDGELEAAPREPRSAPLSGWWTAGITAACVTAFGVAAIVGVTKTKTVRRKRRWSRKLARKKGETAATAIEVATQDEAVRHVAATPCPCGHRVALLTGLAWTHMRFEERTVTSASMPCACGERRVFYFVIAHEAPSAVS